MPYISPTVLEFLLKSKVDYHAIVFLRGIKLIILLINFDTINDKIKIIIGCMNKKALELIPIKVYTFVITSFIIG